MLMKRGQFGNRHKYLSKNGKFIYHISIIDYLQAYNAEKYCENKIKVYGLGRNEKLISAVHPKLYATRYVKFMKENVIIDEKEDLKKEMIIDN